MFRALLPLAGFVLLLLMVAAGAGAASGTLKRRRPAPPARPDKDPLTPSEIVVAVLATLITIPVTLWAFREGGIGVAMVPVLVWFVISTAILLCADVRRERTAQAERAAEAAARTEAMERAEAKEWAARKALAEYGAAGVALLERADTALTKMAGSEAMRTGWLGSPEDLNLRAERAVIADDLRKARAIRRLAEQSQRLGTQESAGMGKDAEAMTRRLQWSAEDRVAALEKCADELDHIDVALAARRRQARAAEQQDELESRLAALLYTVDADRPERPDSVEAIAARAAAVREVAGIAPREPVDDDAVAPRPGAPPEPKETQGSPGGIFGAVLRLFSD